MYKEFGNMEKLISYVDADKNVSGGYATLANRYPIRFVLFDNFKDSFEFVYIMQTQFGCIVESVDNWMDKAYYDTMMTHSRLAAKIEEYVHSYPKNDSVIAPFSELARFYDNKENFEFNALIATIKAIESNKEAKKYKQRVYVPVVGLEGKVSKFQNDTQAFILYFKNTDKQLNYRLILTNNSTYGVQKPDTKYTIVKSIQEWLKVWRDKDAKPEIISTSPSIFANAVFAQPDNAFSFCTCRNVYEFLTDGLKLDFGTVIYKQSDNAYWERLAKEIDISDFSFDKFFNKHFSIYDLSDYNVFIKTWFKCEDEFEKWLLISYYSDKFCQKGYICESIKNCHGYTDYEFFAAIVLTIFDIEDGENNLEERTVCLQQANQRQIKLTGVVQAKLVEKLTTLSIEKGYLTAIRYFSPLTVAEKALALHWLGEGKISKDNIKPFFPDLYYYLGKSVGTSSALQKWALGYTDEYKKAKITNLYTETIDTLVKEQNASNVTFNSWYQDFRTTDTILNGRNDIEVFYWIDGLGVDWIPFISQLLDERKNDHIYLNEVHIACSRYPTTTLENKPALLKLSNNLLSKKGDIDNYAHQSGHKYPDYIIEEIELVKNAINDILAEHAGKKIAIVSDHGLTALSQLCHGLNMAGVESDHSGRVAIRTVGKSVSSNDYILLNDNKTMCALRHESLCGKVPSGQSIHGGCTPEEVLVPIFIISSQVNTTNWTAILLDNEISGTNSVVKYSIKGLSNTDIPYIMYNGKRYELNLQENNIYESDRLNLIENVAEIKLWIGQDMQTSHLKINLGAKENDLFDL
jgi:hypothetical protein